MEIDIVVNEISKEIENKILELFDQGINIICIKDELNIQDYKITKCLKEHGITNFRNNSPVKRYYSKLTDLQKADIVNLYKSGDINKILELYPGLEKQFLYTLMSRNKIKRGS